MLFFVAGFFWLLCVLVFKKKRRFSQTLIEDGFLCSNQMFVEPKSSKMIFGAFQIPNRGLKRRQARGLGIADHGFYKVNCTQWLTMILEAVTCSMDKNDKFQGSRSSLFFRCLW